jgi:hypothetical protein
MGHHEFLLMLMRKHTQERQKKERQPFLPVGLTNMRVSITLYRLAKAYQYCFYAYRHCLAIGTAIGLIGQGEIILDR